MQGTKTYNRWDAHDYAFLHFGRRKGFKLSEIAEALGRTKASVLQASFQMGTWEKGTYMGGKKRENMIKKGAELAFTVNANATSDQYIYWMKKLNRIRGVEFEIVPPETQEEIESEIESEIELEPKTEVDSTAVAPLPPLMTFSVNTEMVIALIKAWRTSI